MLSCKITPVRQLAKIFRYPAFKRRFAGTFRVFSINCSPEKGEKEPRAGVKSLWAREGLAGKVVWFLRDMP
jgi:hypothetical protein